MRSISSKDVKTSRLKSVRGHLASAIPAPLRRASFRQLWLGMASSYAGDRFQQLAQAWLVATLTGSALFGLTALVGGAAVLGLLSVVVVIVKK